jgi:hypothetical protein
VRLLASPPTPNLEDQLSLFVWFLPLDLSSMGDPASIYATTGISLRVSRALKPHHNDKVETPLVGKLSQCMFLFPGPLLPSDSDIHSVPLVRSREKQLLVASILDSFSNLLPSATYLRTNMDTGMGFLLGKNDIK